MWRPPARLRLSFEVEAGPDKRIYSTVRWSLRGPLPRGFDLHGFQIVA